MVRQSNQDEKNVEADTLLKLHDIPSHQAQGRIAILRDGLEHFQDNSELQYGRLMHRILDRIQTMADIPQAIDYWAQRGALNTAERKQIEEEMKTLMDLPQTQSWFDGSAKVLNEMPIIGGVLKGSRRPDRLIFYPDGSVEVIDYKFGEPHKKYWRQVKQYMTLLEQMGYERVRGYLWFVPRKEIIEVK